MPKSRRRAKKKSPGFSNGQTASGLVEKLLGAAATASQEQPNAALGSDALSEPSETAAAPAKNQKDRDDISFFRTPDDKAPVQRKATPEEQESLDRAKHLMRLACPNWKG